MPCPLQGGLPKCHQWSPTSALTLLQGTGLGAPRPAEQSSPTLGPRGACSRFHGLPHSPSTHFVYTQTCPALSSSSRVEPTKTDALVLPPGADGSPQPLGGYGGWGKEPTLRWQGEGREHVQAQGASAWGRAQVRPHSGCFGLG